jgi:hypothetical protein
MTSILTIIAFLLATPAWARDLDAIQLKLSENEIQASYKYGNGDLAERLVNLYCQEQFNKVGLLQEGGCTRMLPIEANTCIASGSCE